MTSVALSSPAAQEVAQELLVCSFQSCTCGKFIGTPPGNAGKSNPFAGGSDEVTEVTPEKIPISVCSSSAGPVLSAVASMEMPVRCSQIYFYPFLGWKMFVPPQVYAVTSPPSQFLWLQTFRIEFSMADPSLRMFLGWFWYQGWSQTTAEGSVRETSGWCCSCSTLLGGSGFLLSSVFRALPQCILVSHPTVLNVRGGRCNLRQLKAEQKTRRCIWGEKCSQFPSLRRYNPDLWLCTKSWAAEGKPQAGGCWKCCPKVSVCSGCAENLPCWDTPLVPPWEKLGRGGGTLGEVGLGAVGPSTNNGQVMSSSKSLSHQTQSAQKCRSCHYWRRGICTGKYFVVCTSQSILWAAWISTKPVTFWGDVGISHPYLEFLNVHMWSFTASDWCVSVPAVPRGKAAWLFSCIWTFNERACLAWLYLSQHCFTSDRDTNLWLSWQHRAETASYYNVKERKACGHEVKWKYLRLHTKLFSPSWAFCWPWSGSGRYSVCKCSRESELVGMNILIDPFSCAEITRWSRFLK